MGKPPALQSNKQKNIWIFRVFWKQVPKIYDFPECLWENSFLFYIFFTQINRKRIHSLFQTRFKKEKFCFRFFSSHRIVINNFTIEKFKRFLYLFFSFSPSLSRTSLFFIFIFIRNLNNSSVKIQRLFPAGRVLSRDRRTFTLEEMTIKKKKKFTPKAWKNSWSIGDLSPQYLFFFFKVILKNWSDLPSGLIFFL